MKFTVLSVKKGEPNFYYYKINERYMKEQEVKFLFFEAKSHEFCIKVSYFDDEWIPMNVFHYKSKNKVCPFCHVNSLSTAICKKFDNEKKELFEYFLNNKYYRLQGIYDFS